MVVQAPLLSVFSHMALDAAFGSADREGLEVADRPRGCGAGRRDGRQQSCEHARGLSAGGLFKPDPAKIRSRKHNPGLLVLGRITGFLKSFFFFSYAVALGRNTSGRRQRVEVR